MWPASKTLLCCLLCISHEGLTCLHATGPGGMLATRAQDRDRSGRSCGYVDFQKRPYKCLYRFQIGKKVLNQLLTSRMEELR